jgi:hypothetical protein
VRAHVVPVRSSNPTHGLVLGVAFHCVATHTTTPSAAAASQTFGATVMSETPTTVGSITRTAPHLALLLVVALPINLLVAICTVCSIPYSRFVRMAAGLYHADTDTGRPKWAAARKAMAAEADSTPWPARSAASTLRMLRCADGRPGLANAEALVVALDVVRMDN